MKRIILLTLLFFPAAEIFAYSPEATHAGLAEQTVYFYNQNFSRQIAEREKDLIIKGAIEEDWPIVRSLNHFYDPIRNIGISGFRTAKDWAVEDFNGNDFAWNVAVGAYARGEMETAFVALGHVLHLIEDMTVPDHTRNDPHMGNGPLGMGTGESSYEKWTKSTKNRETLSSLAISYRFLKPVIFVDIKQFFDFLANYSNRNFFGDDSIKNDVYQYEYPKVIRTDKRFGYSVDGLLGDEFPVINFRINRDEDEEFFLRDDEKTYILSIYFDRLGKQAILAGAGVIDLFFRQAEEARAEHLRRQEDKLRKEIDEATELSRKLESGNLSELVWYGLSSIVEDNLVSPIESKVAVAKDNFVSGSKVVFSGVKNVSSFAVFTTTVFAKQAADKVTGIFASPEDTQKVVSRVAINNLPSISTAVNSFAESTSVNKQKAIETPTMKTRELTEQEEVAVVSLFDILSDLSAAYESLLRLNSVVALTESTKQNAPPATFADTRYFPGFGGGESSLFAQVIPNKGPTFVGDNTVDNSAQVIENTDNEPQDAEMTSEVDIEEGNEPQEAELTAGVDVVEEAGIATTNEAPLFDEVATSTEESLLETIAEAVIPVLDTTPPEINLIVNSCLDSLSDEFCVLATTTVSISWTSPAEDLAYFEINIDGEISTTTETSLIFEFADKTSHNISVVAVDLSDNVSKILSEDFEIFKNPVVINEIAWGGTSGHPEDEWIELYNLSNRVINLNGWTLYSKTDNSPNINLSGKISSRGYYLIERRNDGEENEETESPIRDIKADIWTSFGAGLLNSGETLILSRASTTMDTVPYSLNWYAGQSTRTTERYYIGDKAYFSSNNGEIKNGKNVDGSPIYGTPGARNYQDHLIRQSNGRLDLKLENSPYLVPKSSTLNVGEGIIVNIEPGVVVKFGDGSSMNSDSKISVTGTINKPIVFTTFSDDDYGGDTNSDGLCDRGNASSTASCPSAGRWYGLFVSAKGSGSSFSNTIFRYGALNYGPKKGMITSDSAVIDISDSVFEYSGSEGVVLKNAKGNISDNIFKNNNAISSAAGLNVSGGSLVIENNSFVSNSVGLYILSPDSKIINNSFLSNTLKGIYVLGRPGEIQGNNSSGIFKTGDLINLSGNITVMGTTTRLASNPMPYFISGTVSVVASSTLEIGEGVNIKSTNVGAASRFIVNGELLVSGSEEEPVVFSSNLENRTKGSWQGIIMNPGSRSEIKNAVLKDAATAISYAKSPIWLERVIFDNNQLGLYVSQLPSPIEHIAEVSFGSDNTATTSPKGLW
jgi:hypothetical protein